MSAPELIRGPSDPGRATLHCVLIHGTFASNARWVLPDAEFAQAPGKLDPGGMALSRFIWSGENSHAGRVAAAKALFEALASEAAAHPCARFLLVGHSHGGNIAMNAVGGLPEPHRAGVVCLGTPFIHVRDRSTFPLVWARGGL